MIALFRFPRAKLFHFLMFWGLQVFLVFFGNIYPSFSQTLPSHGFSVFSKLKYSDNFTHFDYVNPKAPKGGTLRLGYLGTFTSLNPFIVRGDYPVGIFYTIATLLEETYDRAGESYCYLAQSVVISADHRTVTFHLNPKAIFSDKTPITADDIAWSFDILKEKGHPMYRTYYKNITKTEVLDKHTIRFTVNDPNNRELPQILGQIPALSKSYYTHHKFDETTFTPPPSSGPYKLVSIKAGRGVAYARDPNWWGKDIPSQKGRHNFDAIKIDYFLENNSLFEAFKSGQYDLRQENQSKNWATGYNFPAAREGRVKRLSLKSKLSSGTAGFFFNMRRPLFQDKRVRKALTLLLEFDWMNKHLFYGLYARNLSYFPRSDFSAVDSPTALEKDILQSLPGTPDPLVWTSFKLPINATERQVRQTEEEAIKLLKEAGYHLKEGVMIQEKTKLPLNFEIIVADKAFERIMLYYANNLQRVGIQLYIRVLDPAAFQLRVDRLDYDMVYQGIPQSTNLGNEQRDYFGSKSADQPGTRNYAGIKDPLIDEVIEKLVRSKSYGDLLSYAHVLDRLLLSGYYIIPGWHSPITMVAYWDKFGFPEKNPPFIPLDITTWWCKPIKFHQN